VSEKVFTNWKNGLTITYMQYIDKIAEFLGVSIDRVTTESEGKTEVSEG